MQTFLCYCPQKFGYTPVDSLAVVWAKLMIGMNSPIDRAAFGRPRQRHSQYQATDKLLCQNT